MAESRGLGDVYKRQQRKVIFFLGVGGLIFVPIFKSITHLPPFVGVMLILGLVWAVTEIFYRKLHEQKDDMAKRVSKLLSHIDMSTILFFLGILMAVSCLEQIGVLEGLGKWLNGATGGNHYIVTGTIGAVSYRHLTLPTTARRCRSRWSPYH